MPGAWPPGRIEPVVVGGLDRVPRDGIGERGRFGHLVVEGARLGGGAELAERAVEQARIGGGRDAAGFGGEDDLVPLAGEQAPGDGGLGRIEVAIRQRHQHARHRHRTQAGTSREARTP